MTNRPPDRPPDRVIRAGSFVLLHRLCQVQWTLAGLFPAEYNSALHFGPSPKSVCLVLIYVYRLNIKFKPLKSGHILVFYNSKPYVSDGYYKYLLHPYTILLHSLHQQM